MRKVRMTGGSGEKVLQLSNARGWPHPRPFLGRAPAEIVMTAMLRRGIDISGHRSREFNRDTVDRAALVIAIGEYQKEEILSLYPSARGKVFTLREFAGKCSYPDAEGPVKRYPPEYVDTFISQIEERLTQGMNKFLHYLRQGGAQAWVAITEGNKLDEAFQIMQEKCRFQRRAIALFSSLPS